LTEQITIILECCKIPVLVTFDHRESPALLPGHFRKNVDCPKRKKLVIVDLVKTGSDMKIEQEVIAG